jgi:hypothetical protein
VPTTVTATNGEVFHLYQLPDLSTPNPVDKKEFTILKNDLSDGYGSKRLFGSNTGLRSWQLKFPSLASTEIPVPMVTDIHGATVSREQYIRSLFDENNIEGTPFAYTDPSSGVRYLVDFVDTELSMERMRVKLYTTGLEIRQRRLVGTTIYDIAQLDNSGWTPWSWIASEDPLDMGGNVINWTEAGDHVTTLQNDHAAWRFNSVGTNGKMSTPGETPTLYDIFLVMKCRETTFGQTSGVLTGLAGDRVLIGGNGTNKFTDLSHTNFEYRLNDVLYDDPANLIAPMGDWGIVHLRFSAGKSIASPQIGQDRAVALTHAEIDVGEVIMWENLLPHQIKREIYEYLVVKWGLT